MPNVLTVDDAPAGTRVSITTDNAGSMEAIVAEVSGGAGGAQVELFSTLLTIPRTNGVNIINGVVLPGTEGLGSLHCWGNPSTIVDFGFGDVGVGVIGVVPAGINEDGLWTVSVLVYNPSSTTTGDFQMGVDIFWRLDPP